MSDGTPETTRKDFNPEAFGQNLARALECSGRALSAYLAPSADGQIKEPPSELTELGVSDFMPHSAMSIRWTPQSVIRPPA